LTKISKYCGERFDLVQAGGGNTSVKTINDWLVIKSSGYNLTSIDTKNGYSVLDNRQINQDIENICYDLLQEYGGWEINEGSQGKIIFTKNEIEIEHEWNTEEQYTSDTIIEINPEEF
jgi:hypothetical protein